jgi:hypothetical protein
MAGKRRPRPFSTIDREYLHQDTVRELGERFGPAGPLIFMAIILEAGKALSGTAPGEVELRFRALARLTFVDVDIAREVVTAAAEVGLLADMKSDGERFRARLTKWGLWETKDRTGAQRSADYRARHDHQEPSA